jgi:hypothetical protein
MRIRNLWVFMSMISIVVAMLCMMNLYLAQNEFKSETERLKLTHQTKEDDLGNQLANLRDEVAIIRKRLEEESKVSHQGLEEKEKISQPRETKDRPINIKQEEEDVPLETSELEIPTPEDKL